MDISQSNSSHSDWAAQLYPQGEPTPFTESSPLMASTTTSTQQGRQGRTTRRRSRPSRRAPTTILNTDEANFRAMVQQFTGFPTRPMMRDHHHHQSINGYVVDPNHTEQQIGIHPFANHPSQYEQFHQQYDGGYEQGATRGAHIGGMGGGGFFM